MDNIMQTVFPFFYDGVVIIIQMSKKRGKKPKKIKAYHKKTSIHYVAASLRLRSPLARQSEGIATGVRTTF